MVQREGNGGGHALRGGHSQGADGADAGRGERRDERPADPDGPGVERGRLVPESQDDAGESDRAETEGHEPDRQGQQQRQARTNRQKDREAGRCLKGGGRLCREHPTGTLKGKTFCVRYSRQLHRTRSDVKAIYRIRT